VFASHARRPENSRDAGTLVRILEIDPTRWVGRKCNCLLRVFCRFALMSCESYLPLPFVQAFSKSLPVRRALPFLPFRVSVPIEWTDCTCLLCPLLTSALRSGRLTASSVPIWNTAQTSRGKLDSLHRIPAGSTSTGPLMDMDFAISRTLVQPEMPDIRFLFVRSRFCFTLPSDATSR